MTKAMFTAYPHLKHMDKYSKQVARLLFKRYPQWLPYASVGHWKEEDYLEVAVPAPVRPRERDLLISTYSGRLTIHFEWYHAHFSVWDDHPLQEMVADAIRFLEAIIREDMVFVTSLDETGGSTYWLPPQDLEKIRPDKISYTRSWKGTFDVTYYVE